MHCMLLLTIGLLVIPSILSFPTGAPDSACTTFVPNHGVAAQSGSASYTITSSQSNYTVGDVITVTITSTGTAFKGFFIKARRADPNLTQEGVGSFTAIAGTQTGCSGVALTHSARGNFNTLTLNYTAPSSLQGHLVFQATIVQAKVTFWTGVTSNIVQDPTAAAITTTPSSNVEVTVDLSGCGDTKGCFRKPSGCTTECSVAATWRRPTESADYVIVEITGKQSGWVAMGLSKDQKMGDDDVYACIHDSGSTEVQSTYNVANGKSNEPLSNKKLGLSNQTSSYVNGILSCSFHRQITVTGSRRKRSDEGKSFNLDTAYYIMIAYGPSAGLFVSQHTDTPIASSEEIDIKTSTFEVGASFTMMQVHGILMLAAWQVLISISLIIARHFRKALPDTKIAAKDVWYFLHVGFNTIALGCTIAGIVIIFVAVGGYSQTGESSSSVDKAHPIIGIVVTIMMIANPIMAIFRCAPDDSKRKYFNILHWLVGTSAHVLATCNLFFGLTLSKSKNFADSWLTIILGAQVAMYSLTFITLEIHRCYVGNKQKDSFEGKAAYNVSQSDTSVNPPTQSDKPVEGEGKFKSCLLLIYALCSLAFFITIVVELLI